MPVRYRFSALYLLLLAVALGQNTDTSKQDDSRGEEQVYDLREGITPPRLVHQVNPAYNPGSRGVRVVGKVVIRLIVTSKGMPKSPQIIQGLEDELDQSALAAVRQWRFEPARRDGTPVAVRVTVEISFHPM